MAMDKEELLQRLQTQYLTRQEVLFKLPLNISINSFWPELINRRKVNSVVLPLHGADSKPLWYVLTDKMIAASEKLCRLALECSENIDPYKMSMTSAMTQEMFFTSFVEGAQIDLQESMNFLERGTEPENVQEQLIQNNRNAWSDMIKMLFYPLDDRFIRSLAYRLTDEMEGHATDYRQTDSHTIAAMGSEAYDVPAAATLPALMQEYYSFLSSTEVHPLIKAAVGQAYLLVARPFPEGNERLSRMISYAVLLRSGYDFFRDISISSIIARENYRYYKCMQDIIRSENGGDLTYFIEYFLDLLARSVDIQAEKERQKQNDMLARERQLATQPLVQIRDESLQNQLNNAETDRRLAFAKQSGVLFPTELVEKYADPNDDIGNEQIIVDEALLGQDEHAKKPQPASSPPLASYSPKEYLAFVRRIHDTKMEKTKNNRKERILNGLIKLVKDQRYRFTREVWEEVTNVPSGTSRDDCSFMRKIGLICCRPFRSITECRHYYLPIKANTIETEEDVVDKEITVALKSNPIMQAVQVFEESEYVRERQMASSLLNMLKSGINEFDFALWQEKNNPPNTNIGFSILRTAINHGLLEFSNGIYRFPETVTTNARCYHLPDKQRSVLLRLMNAFADVKFTVKNAAEATGIKPNTMSYYLDNFLQRGILQLERDSGNANIYTFSNDVHGIFKSAEADGDATWYAPLPPVEKTEYDPLRGTAQVG